jgi:Na+/melibiose symporter-like transporter
MTPKKTKSKSLLKIQEMKNMSLSMITTTKVLVPETAEVNNFKDWETIEIEGEKEEEKLKTKDQIKEDEEEEEEEFKWQLSTLLKFDIKFWLLSILCCLIYGCIFPWMNIGSSFLQARFGYDHKTGNMLLMIPYGLSSIITPIFGAISDRFGKRCHLLLICCFLLICFHACFGFVTIKKDRVFWIS